MEFIPNDDATVVRVLEGLLHIYHVNPHLADPDELINITAHLTIVRARMNTQRNANREQEGHEAEIDTNVINAGANADENEPEPEPEPEPDDNGDIEEVNDGDTDGDSEGDELSEIGEAPADELAGQDEAEQTNTAAEAPTHGCIICTETTGGLFTCPCTHIVCHGCLDMLLERSMTDETLFPPSCCGRPLPVVDNASDRAFGNADVIILDSNLERYRLREREMATRNRTYCSQPRCSTWISPENIQDNIAQCPLPQCGARTCTECKEQAHPGEDCPTDENLEALVTKEGLMTCNGCHRLVELDTGCNHITCRCGYQFCYSCGAPWVSKGLEGACPCPQFAADHLVPVADFNGGGMGGMREYIYREAGRAQRVFLPAAEMALGPVHVLPHHFGRRPAGLAEGVAAAHRQVPPAMLEPDGAHIWRTMRRPGTCLLCRRRMRDTIEQCIHCDSRMCRRCRNVHRRNDPQHPE